MPFSLSGTILRCRPLQGVALAAIGLMIFALPAIARAASISLTTSVIGEGDVLLASKTLTKFGYYATVGVSFPLTNSEIYIEGQYHWVNVEDYFETLPIVIGWRF